MRSLLRVPREHNGPRRMAVWSVKPSRLWASVRPMPGCWQMLQQRWLPVLTLVSSRSFWIFAILSAWVWSCKPAAHV